MAHLDLDKLRSAETIFFFQLYQLSTLSSCPVSVKLTPLNKYINDTQTDIVIDYNLPIYWSLLNHCIIIVSLSRATCHESCCELLCVSTRVTVEVKRTSRTGPCWKVMKKWHHFTVMQPLKSGKDNTCMKIWSYQSLRWYFRIRYSDKLLSSPSFWPTWGISIVSILILAFPLTSPVK